MTKSKSLKTLSKVFIGSILILLVILVLIYFKNQPNVEKPIEIKPVFSLVNGGFEEGTTGWNVRHGYTLDCSESRSGRCSIKSSATIFDRTQENGTGDSRAMWQSYRIYVEEGQQIFVSWWAKTNGTNPVCAIGQYKSCGKDAGVRIGVDFKTNSSPSPVRANNGAMVTFGTPEWTYRSFNDTIRAGEERITIWIHGKPYDYAGGTGWIDDITLEIYDKK